MYVYIKSIHGNHVTPQQALITALGKSHHYQRNHGEHERVFIKSELTPCWDSNLPGELQKNPKHDHNGRCGLEAL